MHSIAGAMESVANNLSELENRRGNEGVYQSIGASVKADGLAGFTATLIDAVTRLTLYVNEVYRRYTLASTVRVLRAFAILLSAVGFKFWSASSIAKVSSLFQMIDSSQ